MSGLPGSGKSTLAEKLAVALSLPVLSIDPIEAAMWRSGLPKEATGVAAYEVARALADEQLKLGLSVIIDAANVVETARETWRTLAAEHGMKPTMIECVCADATVHRQRIEGRVRDIPGMAEVTWE
jgi:predicted kinase